MKIIEQSATRLAFKIGLPFFNGSECDFNRSTGRAVIKRWMLFWPRKPIDIPLDDIASAQLGMSAVSSQGGYNYYPILVLKSGKPINMASFTEAAARKAVDAINAFLHHLGTDRIPGAAP